MPSVLAVPVDELIIGLIAFLIVFGALGQVRAPQDQGDTRRACRRYRGWPCSVPRKPRRKPAVYSRSTRSSSHRAREEASAIRTQAQADRSSIVEEATQRGTTCGRARSPLRRKHRWLPIEPRLYRARSPDRWGSCPSTLPSKVVGESLTDDARVRSTVDAFLARPRKAGFQLMLGSSRESLAACSAALRCPPASCRAS